MDASAVHTIIQAHEERIVTALGLEAWRIQYTIEAIPDGPYAAMCERWPEYQRATITIDPARAADDEDVLDSLVHELLHIVLSPIDLYRAIVTPYVPEGAPDESAETAFTHAIESTLRGLEVGLALSLRSLPVPEADTS